MNHVGRPLLGIYRELPLALFRLQAAKTVALRDYAVQRAAGRASFDLHLHDGGIVQPSDTAAMTFNGPNGMSLRPSGPMLASIVAQFRGRCIVFEVPARTPVPEELVLLHEHTDHYSLQAARPMPLEELNKRLTAFLGRTPGVITSTKAALLERHPELRPEAAGFSENA